MKDGPVILTVRIGPEERFDTRDWYVHCFACMGHVARRSSFDVYTQSCNENLVFGDGC